MTWREAAVCRSSDPDLWFPPSHQQRPPAIDICRTACPVRRECALDALLNNERFGIWAGVRLDRKAIHRARQQLREVIQQEEGAA